MIIWSIMDFLSLWEEMTCESPVICYSFRAYQVLFGLLMIVSFCESKFIDDNFRVLTSVSGKGFFNLFLASMFLVGNDGDPWGYLMTGCFVICGLFFLIAGCCCEFSYQKDLIKPQQVAEQITKIKGTIGQQSTNTNSSTD